jgi:uncharacterized membrane protein
MRSACVSQELKEEVMTVMMIVVRKWMRKKRNKGVVISSLVSPISESPTILPKRTY